MSPAKMFNLVFIICPFKNQWNYILLQPGKVAVLHLIYKLIPSQKLLGNSVVASDRNGQGGVCSDTVILATITLAISRTATVLL